jgi:hypothetical protein
MCPCLFFAVDTYTAQATAGDVNKGINNHKVCLHFVFSTRANICVRTWNPPTPPSSSSVTVMVEEVLFPPCWRTSVFVLYSCAVLLTVASRCSSVVSEQRPTTTVNCRRCIWDAQLTNSSNTWLRSRTWARRYLTGAERCTLRFVQLCFGSALYTDYQSSSTEEPTPLMVCRLVFHDSSLVLTSALRLYQEG